MSRNVLETVARLIALSASSEIEEARTAAYRACEMIRAHGLRVVEQAPEIVSVAEGIADHFRSDAQRKWEEEQRRKQGEDLKNAEDLNRAAKRVYEEEMSKEGFRGFKGQGPFVGSSRRKP